jgi:hypothetical protein
MQLHPRNSHPSEPSPGEPLLGAAAAGIFLRNRPTAGLLSIHRKRLFHSRATLLLSPESLL